MKHKFLESEIRRLKDILCSNSLNLSKQEIDTISSEINVLHEQLSNYLEEAADPNHPDFIKVLYSYYQK